MPRLKWFLIGAIVSMLIGDWLRLKVERSQMVATTSRAVTLAERMSKDTKECLASIQGYQDMLDTTNIVTLARVQTAQLLTKAQQGDKNAAQELTSQGIPQKVKRKELFVSSALEE